MLDIVPRYWTVPAIADLLAISAEKVLGWLRRGELIGVNVAERPGRRPRWRIADSELQRFLRSRQSQPAPVVRRQRRENGERVFFRNGAPVTT